MCRLGRAWRPGEAWYVAKAHQIFGVGERQQSGAKCNGRQKTYTNTGSTTPQRTCEGIVLGRPRGVSWRFVYFLIGFHPVRAMSRGLSEYVEKVFFP